MRLRADLDGRCASAPDKAFPLPCGAAVGAVRGTLLPSAGTVLLAGGSVMDGGDACNTAEAAPSVAGRIGSNDMSAHIIKNNCIRVEKVHTRKRCRYRC